MAKHFNNYLKSIEEALKAGNATEHSHRPALKALFEALDPKIIATNEPKRIACGAPDYIISRKDLPIGYVEAKDVGKPLDEVERSEQLRRYQNSLSNLILTDYLEFRWYVDGELRQSARLARIKSGGGLQKDAEGIKNVEEMLTNFLVHERGVVKSPKELAERMARLTHIIRDIIITTFETEQASNLLLGWREAFAQVLIADLELPERTSDFADMVAQTLAYGLFSARVMDTSPDSFTRAEAQTLIPKSNPFLRRFFSQITSIELDDEPFVSFVDDLVHLLAKTDMPSVLADFGKRTRQADPVVHFYETFLAAYDPKLREARGVYYTPAPVVSYIVRSVDHLLKTRFNLPQGLADSSKTKIKNTDPSQTVKGKKEMRKTTESHRVLVLDPATGTGTFLYAVIDHIRQQFIDSGNAGMWQGYVRNHLLPRLFGFELLMAPYAVAHFKLSLQLAGRDLPAELQDSFNFTPNEGERLGIYLTDALEEAHEMSNLPLFTQWVAEESRAADEVKRRLPVLVVMGNPPYSANSSNKGEWITKAIQDDYYPNDHIKERNPKLLLDDYVKFIKWGQWRIEESGSGVLAFISNNGYLSNPTFRKMRQELLNAFSEIFIVNLHGDSRKKETAPNGIIDENVFDIQQGVTIGIFVKTNQDAKNCSIHYTDIWGKRDDEKERTGKYSWLFAHSLENTTWKEIQPKAPFYLFTPYDMDIASEYEKGVSVRDIFNITATGVKTHRDHFAIDFDQETLKKRIERFRDLKLSDDHVREFHKLRDTRDWKLKENRIALSSNEKWNEYFAQCTYRPFDIRAIFNHANVVELPRTDVMQNMILGENLGLVTTRIVTSLDFCHVSCTRNLIEMKSCSHDRGSNLFPLYLYPDAESQGQKSLFSAEQIWQPDQAQGGRVPNLNPAFVKDVEEKLGLTFQTSEVLETSEVSDGFFTPEDLFHYIYAIFHSPTYRQRYAEFLKIDFPRVPITGDVKLFRQLGKLGAELVSLHLLESPQLNQFITRYPVAGDNLVAKGYPKYLPHPTLPPRGEGSARPPSGGDVRRTEGAGRVQINKDQYIEGIPPDVWAFQVGGYQVLAKWLKDRRGRQLTYDDLTHYQKIVVALKETIRIMDEIDAAIGEFPLN